MSRSAVSRVFTPGASVSDKTAEKVRRAAEELGYRPNALARGLMTGRSRLIGLVVAKLDNQLYPQALDLLSRRLAEEGYRVLVFLTSETLGDVDPIVDDILDYQVDGLILASVALSSDLGRRCRERGVPVVLFNRRLGTPGERTAVSDNHAGGRLAAAHLVGLGRRRIAHIAGWEGASTQQEREAGFIEGLAEAGLALADRAVADFDPGCAADAARAMFAGPSRPDAVFVATDLMSFAVMDVLRCEMGLRVPDDVAVIGFDDVPAAGWPAYDLSTIGQDIAAMTERTVSLLLSAIGGRENPGVEPLAVKLVARSSTLGSER